MFNYSSVTIIILGIHKNMKKKQYINDNFITLNE